MSDTKRIRYNGKGGAVVQNQFGVWDASDEDSASPYSRDKDVPSAYADRMVGEGQYEDLTPRVVTTTTYDGGEVASETTEHPES
jgi:hypothetical protein